MAKKKQKKEKDEMIHIDGAEEKKQKVTEETAECESTETAEEVAEADEGSAENAADEPEEKDSEPAEESEEESSPRKKRRERKADKQAEQIRELQDKYQRQIAEFDNFRKRTEKEKSQMYAMGAKDVLEKMLEVVDNFERGLTAIDGEDRDDAFVQGMQMVYKQMMETLDKLGVKPIEAVGKEFDPDYHNAVMHEEDEDAGENQVVEEFQKGYLYHDDVIRHSMVKVAN